jgi:hypothetical protein
LATNKNKDRSRLFWCVCRDLHVKLICSVCVHLCIWWACVTFTNNVILLNFWLKATFEVVQTPLSVQNERHSLFEFLFTFRFRK